MIDTQVFYLVRGPLGVAPVKRFADSVSIREPGCPHRLTVVYNKLIHDELHEECEAALADVRHDGPNLGGRALDISAYVWVAERSSSAYVCFLNTYSEPVTHNWLRQLRQNAEPSGVGLVGATGSWESRYSSLIQARPYLRGSVLLNSAPSLMRRKPSVYAFRADYPPFPNYHIRSTGFVIRRDRFTQLSRLPIDSKEAAFRFESGKQGMTSQVLSQRLNALVIGRDGRAFEKGKRDRSATFRSAQQQNLLIADNRTRQYQSSDQPTKRRLSELA